MSQVFPTTSAPASSTHDPPRAPGPLCWPLLGVPPGARVPRPPWSPRASHDRRLWWPDARQPHTSRWWSPSPTSWWWAYNSILHNIKYKTCHVIAITATFDPRLFLARMPGTSFQCILSWGFIQFSPLFSCDVISCFRPLLLPAGAGGRYGERGHLPHLELGLLGQELSRGCHLAPPPQQQQQQIGQQHQQR